MKRKIVFLVIICLAVLISCDDEKLDNPMINTEWMETTNTYSFQFSEELVAIKVKDETVYILSYIYDDGKIFAQGGINYNDRDIYFTAEINEGDEYGINVGQEYLLLIENGVSSTIKNEKYYKK